MNTINETSEAQGDAAYSISEETYQSIPSALLNDLTVKGGEKQPRLIDKDIAIFALLKVHAQQKDWCNVGHERLGKLSRNSVSTIRRSLVRLEAAGHIQRKSNTGDYKILILTDVISGKVIKRSPKHSNSKSRFQMMSAGRVQCASAMEIETDAAFDFAETQTAPEVTTNTETVTGSGEHDNLADDFPF